jgi:hypothetical protein
MSSTLMTPGEAVAYLRLDQQGLQQPLEALRWLCRRGKLRYAKVGRYVRFRKDWLDELIERSAIRRDPPSVRPQEHPSTGTK